MLELNRDVTVGRCYLVRGRANVLTLLGSADWQAQPILEFHDLAPLQGSISARVATWTLSAAQTDAVLGAYDSAPFRVLLGNSVLVAGTAHARSGWVGVVEQLPIEVAGGAVLIGPQGIGVVSAGTTQGGHLVFVLDTGEVLDAGMVPVPPSVEAAASSAASSASTATTKANEAAASAATVAGQVLTPDPTYAGLYRIGA